jgi:hypothetical protein
MSPAFSLTPYVTWIRRKAKRELLRKVQPSQAAFIRETSADTRMIAMDIACIP